MMPDIYKVFYKVTATKKQQVVDYVADGLYDLRNQLTADGVSYKDCDFIYVHRHAPDGSVQEIVAYEREASSHTVADAPATNVVPIKPKVRLKAEKSTASISKAGKVIESMFFKAMEA